MKNTMGKINSKLDIKEEKMNDLKGVIVNDFITTQREKGQWWAPGELQVTQCLVTQVFKNVNVFKGQFAVYAKIIPP